MNHKANGEAPEDKKSTFWRLLRRTGQKAGFVLYALALVSIIVTVWAAYINVAKLGWGPEAAAWIQAAGSIAAIMGAAWLARSEERRAKRLRRERDEETAWYVRFAIQQAQFESQIIAAELVNRTTPVTRNDIREWRLRAVTSATSLSALVSRTDYIHPVVTQVASNAKILMDNLMDDLRTVDRIVEEGGELDEGLIGQIVAPHRALLELINLYDSRMRGIRSTLDESNDALPIKELAAWQTNRERK